MLSRSETRLLDELCQAGEARCQLLATGAVERGDFKAAAYLVQIKERYAGLRRDVARGPRGAAHRKVLRSLVEILDAEVGIAQSDDESERRT